MLAQVWIASEGMTDTLCSVFVYVCWKHKSHMLCVCCLCVSKKWFMYVSTWKKWESFPKQPWTHLFRLKLDLNAKRKSVCVYVSMHVYGKKQLCS